MGNARKLGGLLNPNSSVGALSNRNLIINGNFEINQRGRSGSYTSTGFEYGFDRWAMAKNDVVNFTWEFDYFSNGFTDIPGAKGLVQYGLNSANSGTDFVRLEQRIEDVKTLANEKCTLSFWARSTGSTITLNQTALTNTGPVGLMQYFGTGGSPSGVVDIPFTQSITLTSTWTKYIYTIDVPSISGKTIGTNGNDHLRLYICGMDDDDVGKTVQVAQVQLERGDTATPFEHRSYGDELARCQRYYSRLSSDGTAYAEFGHIAAYSSTNGIAYIQYPTTMRSSPSATQAGSFWASGNANLSVTTFVFQNATKNGIRNNVSVSSGYTVDGSYRLRNNNDPDAYMEFDAEL